MVGGVLFTAMASDSTTDVSASHTSFLAFDFGLKRTGVAVGNRLTRTATPQSTIRAEGDARLGGRVEAELTVAEVETSTVRFAVTRR